MQELLKNNFKKLGNSYVETAAVQYAIKTHQFDLVFF